MTTKDKQAIFLDVARLLINTGRPAEEAISGAHAVVFAASEYESNVTQLELVN